MIWVILILILVIVVAVIKYQIIELHDFEDYAKCKCWFCRGPKEKK